MASELRPLLSAEGHGAAGHARALTRLVVLPFRSLRPDPETDFLVYSLPDAISTSLSGLGSLVVRSSALAARFGGEHPDLQLIASAADVDLVVFGTLLRAGEQLRVSTQLVEASSGTLVASHSLQAPLGDLFALQDDLSRRLVEALALPLAGREAAPRRDVPKSARAYELYLRANEVSRGYDQIPVARDLYLGCLDEDPSFAPAWARLGRAYRLIGKYIEDGPANRERAESAMSRALELNSDLTLAHKLYAHLEAEGGRAREAMVRLLEQAQRHRQDPELFAGLVHTCRYCGLFEASVAAHEEARRLDPHIPMSLTYTLLLNGDFERLVLESEYTTIDSWPRAIGLFELGRADEARALLDTVVSESAGAPRILRISVGCLRPLIDGDRNGAVAATEKAMAVLDDPEALFLHGRFLARIDETQRSLAALTRAVAGGFLAAPALERDRNFEDLRGLPEFQAIALVAFRDAGGDGLLGL